MGLGTLIGTTLGSVYGPAGSAVGSALGGMFDSATSGNGRDEGMDEYTAYKLQREKQWEAMFGPMEQNLVDHYTNMSASSYIAKGNEILEKQHAITQQRMSAQLTARGLDIKGGISTSILRDSLTYLGTQKAQLQAGAEDYIAKQQQQFYSGMQKARPDAGRAVAANATYQQGLMANQDKKVQAGIAGAIDIAGKIGSLELGGQKQQVGANQSPSLRWED